MKNDLGWFDIPRIAYRLFSLVDWVSPLYKQAEIEFKGLGGSGGWTFFISETQALRRGWDKGRIEKLLANYGYEPVGFLVRLDTMSFSVPVEEAHDIEQLLTENRVPLDPISTGAPLPEQETGSLLDAIDALLDTFL